jgi:hypothetical protein
MQTFLDALPLARRNSCSINTNDRHNTANTALMTAEIDML